MRLRSEVVCVCVRGFRGKEKRGADKRWSGQSNVAICTTRHEKRQRQRKQRKQTQNPPLAASEDMRLVTKSSVATGRDKSGDWDGSVGIGKPSVASVLVLASAGFCPARAGGLGDCGAVASALACGGGGGGLLLLLPSLPPPLRDPSAHWTVMTMFLFGMISS